MTRGQDEPRASQPQAASTFTLGAAGAELVSSWAVALEAAHGVEAAAALAQAWDGLALVHIYREGGRGMSQEGTKASVPTSTARNPTPLTLAGPGVDTGDEATAAGVWLRRTELARETPGPAHGGTA